MSNDTFALVLHALSALDRPRAPRHEYRCGICHWRGAEPSITDHSELDHEGEMQRVHELVCPRCFNYVVSA